MNPSEIPSQTPTLSPLIRTNFYGGSGGNYYEFYNQGRISGFTAWGITTHVSQLTIKQWIADGSLVNSNAGYSISQNCAPFNLSSKDYIIGYTVYYDAFVNGLEFHSLNGYNYSCIYNQTGNKMKQLYQPSNGMFYYLSGFAMRHGAIMDAIAFEFQLGNLPIVTNNATTLPTQTPIPEYELILHQGPPSIVFPNRSAAYSYNENDPNADLYSIIGSFNDNQAKLDSYRNNNSEFQFKLLQQYPDGSSTLLEWRQTNWLNQANITGADLFNIPANNDPERLFRGLGLNNIEYQGQVWSIADGNGDRDYKFWNSVGEYVFYGPNGIPAFNGQIANAVSLYILKLVGSSQSPETVSPTTSPLTTARPITSEPTLQLNPSPTSPFSQCLNNGREIHAWYDGESIDLANDLWVDKSRNNNTGEIVVNTGIGLFDGTDTSNTELYLNGQPSVTGTTQTQIVFNVAMNSTSYTVLHLAKYRADPSTKHSILHGDPDNIQLGFWNTRSGVAYSGYWITTESDRFGTEWVLSTHTPQLYRGNAIDWTSNIQTSSSSNTNKLRINDYAPSDFAMTELILFNEILEEAEIVCIENYFNDRYSLSFTNNPTMPSIENTMSYVSIIFYLFQILLLIKT